MESKIYIIHGKDGKDCISIMKEHNLNKKQCVFVREGFEAETETNTAEYEHIYGETK